MALVVLRRYLTLSEAYAAAGALRSAGLHPSVFDEGYGTVMWTEQYYLGGFRLALPEVEIEPAVDVLRQAYDPKPAPETDDAAESKRQGLRGRLPSFALVPLALVALAAVSGGWTVTAYRQRPTPFRFAVMALYIALMLFTIWAIWPRASD